MLMGRSLATALVVFSFAHLGQAEQADINLQAKWPATPLLLEAAEFLVRGCLQDIRSPIESVILSLGRHAF